MKTSFVNALLVVGMIALVACSSSTWSESEFEPYQVGSFKITSPLTAKYIGLSNKTNKVMKIDSVVIDSVGDFQLTIESNPAQRYLLFRFVDSTFTSKPDSIDVKTTDMHFYMTNSGNIFIPTSGYEIGIGKEYTFVDAYVFFNGCNFIGNIGSDIVLEYYEKGNSDNVYKKYLIKTNNLLQASQNISCY